jgi:hypothetical protein
MSRSRREFPTKVRIAVIKRATRDNVVYCEKCGGIAKKFQIDHVIADSHGGEPVIENAQLLGECCYSEKNPKDTTIAAKLKRIEARHIGATRPKQTIKSANTLRVTEKTRDKLPMPNRRAMFEDIRRS